MSLVYSMAREGYVLEKVRGGRKENELMRFRHRIFREELRWLPESQDGSDRDDYDPISDNYAVSVHNQVVGSVRLTLGRHDFMLEHEFLALLPQGWTLHKGEDSAEITRFAVGQGADGRRSEVAAQLLYFNLYQWSQAQQVRWMYFVVEPSFFRHILRMGFPAFAIGPARALDGGVISQAGYLDWSQATPAFIHWLRSGSVTPVVVQERLHGSDYLH